MPFPAGTAVPMWRPNRSAGASLLVPSTSGRELPLLPRRQTLTGFLAKHTCKQMGLLAHLRPFEGGSAALAAGQIRRAVICDFPTESRK